MATCSERRSSGGRANDRYANGDLFGTTAGGGNAGSDGNVFEITNSGFVIATAIAPNFPLLQQHATNFLAALYTVDPVVAVNGPLTKLLTDLGDLVTHPMTSPTSLVDLIVPVSILLADLYAQSPNLAADNATLVGVANSLDHGFQVV